MAITQNIHVFRNFITETECKLLTDWIIKNYTTEVFANSEHPGTIRLTTRFYPYSIKFPALSYEIQKRIDDKIIKIFKNKKIEKVPSFVDGMYASYAFNGDECKQHTDPVYIPNTTTYHCNLILTNHKGGQLFIDDKEYNLNKTDLILYPVSLIPHKTTKLVDEQARMFWNFGYCISDCDRNCKFKYSSSTTIPYYVSPVYERHDNNNLDSNVTRRIIECLECHQSWTTYTQYGKPLFVVV